MDRKTNAKKPLDKKKKTAIPDFLSAKAFLTMIYNMFMKFMRSLMMINVIMMMIVTADSCFQLDGLYLL